MPKSALEKKVKHEMKPVVEKGMHKFLGLTIDELAEDITSKIEVSPFLNVKINTSLPFKEAKKIFKREYLKKLLQSHHGNISTIAKLAEIDRRSVHRIVKSNDVKKIRKEMLKPSYVKEIEVSGIIEDALDSYKTVIHPDKLKEMYQNVSELSKDIVKSLPEKPMTLKDAEKEFEKRYLEKALAENNHNISQTAKKIQLRYAVLHRKLKTLGMI